MAADIVPVIAGITGVPEGQVRLLFQQAWAGAKQINQGRADSQTYVHAVLALKEALGFSLSDLSAGWKIRDELLGVTSSFVTPNSLPMPR